LAQGLDRRKAQVQAARMVIAVSLEEGFMAHSAIEMLRQGNDHQRPETLDRWVAGVAPLLPMLDVIPNAAIFIKDVEARYVLANRTLVERCGLKQQAQMLGKTSTDVFPAQFGPGYTEQDQRVLKQGLVLENQLELHLYRSREPGWCMTHKRALYNHAGEIIGLMGVSVDLQSASDMHPAYQRLAAVDEHIRTHFHQPITLRDLTRIAQISVAQLERYCKRVFHLTPRQLIQTVRLENAHRLLLTNLPITDVAIQCGYTDHSAFSRQFKMLTGFSPRQYRQATGRE
jgi:AraC-like DNA-binding protein/PAS domain-containing protein